MRFRFKAKTKLSSQDWSGIRQAHQTQSSWPLVLSWAWAEAGWLLSPPQDRAVVLQGLAVLSCDYARLALMCHASIFWIKIISQCCHAVAGYFSKNCSRLHI